MKREDLEDLVYFINDAFKGSVGRYNSNNPPYIINPGKSMSKGQNYRWLATWQPIAKTIFANSPQAPHFLINKGSYFVSFLRTLYDETSTLKW